MGKISLWLGATTTWETVLKSHRVREVETALWTKCQECSGTAVTCTQVSTVNPGADGSQRGWLQRTGGKRLSQEVKDRVVIILLLPLSWICFCSLVSSALHNFDNVTQGSPNMVLSPPESQALLLFSWDLAALLSVREKQCGRLHCWQTQGLHSDLCNMQLISIQTRCPHIPACDYQVCLYWCFVLFLLFVFNRASLSCPGLSRTTGVKPPSCLSWDHRFVPPCPPNAASHGKLATVLCPIWLCDC